MTLATAFAGSDPNPEQLAAIEAPGVVFVSAGAGTGKTTVLVERFVRALCERGLAMDAVLVITYTERAAGELRGRIRRRLGELGRADLARELDGAWISTIHGFCHRLLRAHPFAVGLDPRFRVLDESQARVLRGEAFRDALESFCASGPQDRLALLATYGAGGLRRMLTAVHETLRSAGRPLELTLGPNPELQSAVAAAREAAACLRGDESATDAQRDRAERLWELLQRPPATEFLIDLAGFASRGERAGTYEAARRTLEQAALDELAGRDRELLEALLQAFDGAYGAAKERESAVDFEDLQLLTRKLLRENDGVRERERWRLRSIMVDEFQDTNRLQCELIDLLAGDELFFVGDEFQSIYGFRHADVEVFRQRRAASAGVLALTRNYRSRPEVLGVINHLFSADFGADFQPLAAASRFPGPLFGPAVELLVTDKESYDGADLHWRRAEARHIARRVRELVDAGEAQPGEIVLLFAAGTDAEVYEEELRAASLPTYRATGRGYFGQQQVVDLLGYLRLLQNRYDDEALVTVLASPLVGVSNDALVLLRRAAGRRPLFAGLERSLPEALRPSDERLFRAFRQRYERLVRRAERLSLEALCELIVAEHDYDLAVLSQWDGRRRYANVRKLARLARSYEELRGPDIEGFVRFVREQDAVGAREVEAAAEEEGADAVRLLTIHAAKGLEFKVVVVADAGREARAPSGDQILCLPDGRFGFQVADPATGKRRGAFDYSEVKRETQRADEEERRRLYYVAMTRAIERLIVSGAFDRRRKADETTPIGWVLGRLAAEGIEVEPQASSVALGDGGERIRLRVDRHEPAATPPEESRDSQLALFAVHDEAAPFVAAPALPPLAEIPQPPEHEVRRLSYSALALYERCAYRFYAERVAGLRPVRRPRDGPGGMAATELGDAVHLLLERADPASRFAPDPEGVAELVRGRYPAVTDEELARILSLLGAYAESELARRLAGLAGVAVERPFAFEHDGVLLHGRLDVFHRDAGRTLVVDYKTNLLEGRSPSEIVESEYRLQRTVYALACLRAGAGEVEVVYQFLEEPDALVACSYSRDDVAALEGELSAAIATIRAGRFAPTPGETVCSDCPALDVVCAGPRLRGAERSSSAPSALVPKG